MARYQCDRWGELRCRGYSCPHILASKCGSGSGLSFDANDSSSITLSDNDVAEWIDKSGNGYDMIAQGHPTLVDYGYGTGLKVVRFESDQKI